MSPMRSASPWINRVGTGSRYALSGRRAVVSSEARIPTVSAFDRRAFASRAYACTSGSVAVASAACWAKPLPAIRALHPQCGDARVRLPGQPRRRVARRVRDHQRVHARGVPAHDLLCDVPAEAQPHEHEPLARKVLQQRLDVATAARNSNSPVDSPWARRSGTTTEKRFSQGGNLRVPAAMVEGGAVQQHDRGLRELRGRAADPVTENGVGPDELVRRQGDHEVPRRSGVEPARTTSSRGGEEEQPLDIPSARGRNPVPAHCTVVPPTPHAPGGTVPGTPIGRERLSRDSRPAAGPAGCAAAGRRPREPPGPARRRWRARSTGGSARG